MSRKLLGGHLYVVLFGLCCEHSLRLISVTLSLTILLIGILDIDFFVHEKLVMHRFDSFVGSFERVVRDKAETFRYPLVITGNLEKR